MIIRDNIQHFFTFARIRIYCILIILICIRHIVADIFVRHWVRRRYRCWKIEYCCIFIHVTGFGFY